MKRVVFLVTVVLIFYYSGCATYTKTTTETYVEPSPIERTLVIKVIDIDSLAVENAKVRCVIEVDKEPVKIDSGLTDSLGIFRTSIIVKGTREYTSISYPSTEFKFEISKDGYYRKKGSKFNAYYERKDSTYTKSIILYKPIDYFDKEFAGSLTDIELKERILQFIDLIVLQGLFQNASLDYRSIRLSSFKGRSYIRFEFTHGNTYNSNRVNKYELGRILFDEVIRKILNPLNVIIGGSNLFYGYDIIVTGKLLDPAKANIDVPSTGDYLQDAMISALAKLAEIALIAKYTEKIEYRFLMPERIVRQYKNLDITGQQLLDSSIILMNNERIGLKLQ